MRATAGSPCLKKRTHLKCGIECDENCISQIVMQNIEVLKSYLQIRLQIAIAPPGLSGFS